MPELPEVEVVATGLRGLVGQRLKKIQVNDPRLLVDMEFGCEKFAGQKLEEIFRIGKYIIYRFDNGYLLQHLRMTGKMLPSDSPVIPSHLWQGKKISKQIRAKLDFEKNSYSFWDTRRFGTFSTTSDLELFFKNKNYASDPIREGEKAFKNFLQKIKSTSRPIKSVLLDQSVAAGVGNIYADEALFLAGIHPRTAAHVLTDKVCRRLFDFILSLFERAIAAGGTTANNYLDANGDAGTYSNFLNVYGRTGEACSRCKKGKVLRIVLAGRSTHYCKNCQRLLR